MKIETKVGLLFVVAMAFVVGFAYALGDYNPFSSAHSIFVTYNYAGGIQEGSPVRVMGIKVGKVQAIYFDPNQKDESGSEVKLKVKISVDKRAWGTIRKDSKFYINIAGVIGEKFIEVTPGTMAAEGIRPGDVVRGEDPPRIDQLISQGYGLAGKLLDLVESNKGSVTQTLQTMNQLVTNLNKTLAMIDKNNKKGEIGHLMGNLIQITDDLKGLTKHFRTEDANKTIDLIHKLIWRLEGLDGPAIKKFFQEEGVRARIF